MNKLLFLIENTEGGGTQIFLKKLTDYMLVNTNINIIIICLSKEKKNKNIIKMNHKIKLFYLNKKENNENNNFILRFYNNLIRIKKLRNTIHKKNPNIAISFIANTNILFILSTLGMKKFKKIICERNDPEKQSLGSLKNYLRKLLYNKSDMVTFNNVNSRNFLKKYVDAHKLFYVPNFVDQENHSFNYSVKNQIVAVGRLESQKNYFFMIRAFKKLSENNNKLKLIILGEGSLKNILLNFARSHKILDKIEFHGFVKNPSTYYKNSDLLIMTSLFEGMSNAVLEAMSYGLPCLVSSSFATNISFFRNNRLLVFEEENTLDFVEKATFLFKNYEKRQYLGNESRKFVNINNELSKNKWKSIFDI
jgi:glycosyltransferase involved in cell wall biosynthesis